MTPDGGTRSGRPLRFLAMVMSGWIGLRIVLLWPEGATVRQAIRAALPVAMAETPPRMAAWPLLPPRSVATTTIDPVRISPSPSFTPAPASMPATPARRAVVDADRVQLALLALVRFGAVEGVQIDPLPVPVPAAPDQPRVTVSAWALARPGVATGGPVQLGGGQAGLRMQVPVRTDGRVALSARLSSPLSGPGREAALGIEWRPIDAPVALVIERRTALDRSGSGTGFGVIAGLDRPGAIAGFDLEAYGQAGAVARAGIEPYADGAVRGLRAVATPGRSVIRVGIGGWGGAQRGAARIDIGPSAVVAMPVGGKPVRLSIDWRQRVAGNAAPGSGPAVTLGSDF